MGWGVGGGMVTFVVTARAQERIVELDARSRWDPFQKIVPAQNDRFRIVLSSVPPEHTCLSLVVVFATPGLDNSTRRPYTGLQEAELYLVFAAAAAAAANATTTQQLLSCRTLQQHLMEPWALPVERLHLDR